MTRSFTALCRTFARDDKGANALEYALVMILVAMAITAGAGFLGTKLNGLFSGVGSAVGAVVVPTL